MYGRESREAALLATHVLLLNLGLLFWSKVVLNVEQFADLLGCLAFDHVGANHQEEGPCKHLPMYRSWDPSTTYTVLQPTSLEIRRAKDIWTLSGFFFYV